MKLDPTTLTAIAACLLGVIYLYHRDDPRAWEWVKAQWSETVGKWFAKRRFRVRIDNGPSTHCRRDINVGNWT